MHETVSPKFMTRYIFFILTCLLSACGTISKDHNGVKGVSSNIDSANGLAPDAKESKDVILDTTEYEYATFFIVVADTSLDYSTLHNKMLDLNRKYKIPVDTMGRCFNKTKNLIALPDNDEDELYAGDYFPRRFPTESLSLEYLNFYQKQSGEKTIALVTGIYETEKSADSALSVLSASEKKVFKIKADIYLGCMH